MIWPYGHYTAIVFVLRISLLPGYGYGRVGLGSVGNAIIQIELFLIPVAVLVPA